MIKKFYLKVRKYARSIFLKPKGVRLHLIVLIALCINSALFFAFPVINYIKDSGRDSGKEKKAIKIRMQTIEIEKKKKKKKKKLRIEEEQKRRRVRKKSSRFKLKLSAAGGEGAAITDDDIKNIIYREGEVDRPPVLINPEVMNIPSTMETAGKRGTFEMELVVDEYGNPRDIEYISGPEEQGFNVYMRNQAMKMKFKPAMKNNIPVRCRILIPFRY
ncbi:energy transducer TonB [Spirochaetota bacterium]